MLLALGALLLLSLIVPLANTGLWDPYELETAELARRVAVNLFGADSLARTGTEDSIPTVEEVGRGELPLLATALGLKLFGSAGWALRSTLFLWATLALLSVYWVTSRLGSRRLGALSAVVLCTSPLFFVHARTALGEIATMACLAVAFGAAMLAVFDLRMSVSQRAACLGLAALAVVGGFFCRGALIGVSVPLLATGVTWLLVQRGSGLDRSSSIFALGCLTLGVGFGIWGTWAGMVATEDAYWMALGSAVEPTKQFPTHDFVVHRLGHGLFPWSALLPVALGFALRMNPDEAAPKRALRVGMMLSAVFGVGVYVFLAPKTGLLPFAPVFALAALIALAVEELDRDAAGTVPAALLTASFLLLLAIDFDHFPKKAFSAFAIDAAQFPESFEKSAKRFVLIAAALGFSGCAALVVHRALGNSGIERFERWARVLGRRLWLGRRGGVFAATITASALVLSLGYYPALGAQLSPVGAFDAYRDLAGEDEPLALMGSHSGSMFFAGSPAEVFESTKPALDWLLDDSQRRWLVVKGDDLANINSRYRKERHQNVPVLDARSTRALLLSNRLGAGEVNKNPLAHWLPEERPQLAHPLDVVLGDKLRVLGWEVRKKNGEPASVLDRGEHYRFVIGYEVLSRVSGNWKTFIHIDGEGKRFNGDHETLEGEYPYRYWNDGDFILDTYDLVLDSSYNPGMYRVYFGLFSGDNRLPVTSGEHDDDRVAGGNIEVIDQ